MNRKHIDCAFKIKSVDDSGKFAGYGSVFGNKDSYLDIIEKGAFADSIKAFKEENEAPAMLWQHKMDTPIGVYTEFKEDEKGLWVEGQINLDVQQGKEAHSLMKQGALKGLSIGYTIPKNGGEWDEKQGAYIISKVNLWEISPVTFPANEKAKIENVKSHFGGVNERFLETVLRDAGLTRKQAKAVLADGFKGMSEPRDASEEAVTDELKNLISKFKGE